MGILPTPSNRVSPNHLPPPSPLLCLSPLSMAAPPSSGRVLARQRCLPAALQPADDNRAGVGEIRQCHCDAALCGELLKQGRGRSACGTQDVLFKSAHELHVLHVIILSYWLTHTHIIPDLSSPCHSYTRCYVFTLSPTPDTSQVHTVCRWERVQRVVGYACLPVFLDPQTSAQPASRCVGGSGRQRRGSTGGHRGVRGGGPSQCTPHPVAVNLLTLPVSANVLPLQEHP